MKKTLKLAAFAVAAMSLMVACKNAPEAVEEDTTPIEEVIEEVVEDTMPVIDTVEVAVEEPAAPAKKATSKKKATTPEQQINKTTTKDGKTIMSVGNGDVKMEIKADGKSAMDAVAPVKKK